jgi:hypothetical protein
MWKVRLELCFKRKARTMFLGAFLFAKYNNLPLD